ncbi:MAG TPA: GNAT family N-acetyltransferase [Jiangellaceae bacterium]|nr:GNAT family N-acetyltransferase [Jiangellaceae bacterium]
MGEVREAADADGEAVRATCAAALRLDLEAAELPAHLIRPPAPRDWTCLVSEDGLGVVFASTVGPAGRQPNGTSPGSPVGPLDYVDLLAVHPAAQGRGLGASLVGAAEEWLGGRGVTEVRLAGHQPCYAWPGIDVRYTPAVCLAERLGYERYQIAWNMAVDLSGDLSVDRDVERLSSAGVEVRSAAAPGDRAQVAEFALRHWNDSWAWEVEHAAGCHYATRDGVVVGFAAWGARPAWFGPMGTAPAATGLGIGRVLLRRCLAEQRDAGQSRAEISWVGPLRFYSRAVGARTERVFALYRRRLEGAHV